MTVWFRQHRESLWFRMPWHLEDPTPTRAAMLGPRLAYCGTTMAAEDRGMDTMDDPPLDDRTNVEVEAELSASYRGKCTDPRCVNPDHPRP